MTAAHVNLRSCGGPSTEISSYVTWRPLRARSSCRSVFWSTRVVSACSIWAENASTTASSIAAKPCWRKSAPSAASITAASTLRFRDSRCSSSAVCVGAACSTRRRPRSSSFATSAHVARETTWERTFASRPSEKSGCRAYSACATASSRTLSPRNSSLSYDAERSLAHDVCVKTGSASSGGSPSISCARSPLLVGGDVVDGLADGLDLLRVLVRDLDPELVLELHDQLHEVDRVGVELLLEGRLLRDVRLVDAELLGEDLLDPLVDFRARRCHVTSCVVGAGKARRSYSLGLLEPGSETTHDVVVDTAGGEPDRIRNRRRRGVAVRDHDQPAEAEEVRATVGVGVEARAQPPGGGTDEEAAERSGRARRDLLA